MENIISTHWSVMDFWLGTVYALSLHVVVLKPGIHCTETNLDIFALSLYICLLSYWLRFLSP